MKILAFDQATVNSGYAFFDGKHYVESGVIHKDDNENIETRVINMGLAICAKIKELQPDLVVIEGTQTQSNAKIVIQLSRLQGCIMLYCASKKIKYEILTPTQWRSTLEYRQGSKVKREELKQQSLAYVKEHLGFDNLSDDQAEACCINMAAQKLYEK